MVQLLAHWFFSPPVGTPCTARMGPMKHLFCQPQSTNKSLNCFPYPSDLKQQFLIQNFFQRAEYPQKSSFPAWRHVFWLSAFWLADAFWLHHVSYRDMMGNGTTVHVQWAAQRSNPEVKTEVWNIGCSPLWHHKETTSRMLVWMQNPN